MSKIKLGLGLYRHMLNNDSFRFARQCGCTHLVVHLADYYGGQIVTATDEHTNYGAAKAGEEIWSERSMKALQERADLNRQIEQLQARLYNNAVVQEVEKPAEDPQELMDQLDRAAARLEELMAAINLANCRTVVDGLTLTERIARKDCLRLRLEAYRELVQAASQTARRATRSEIRILSAVDVRALQGKVDAMARELRLLDNQLQQINWTTEL